MPNASVSASNAPQQARRLRLLAMTPAGLYVAICLCDAFLVVETGHAGYPSGGDWARLGASAPSSTLLIMLVVLGLFGWANRFRTKKRAPEVPRETSPAPSHATSTPQPFLSDNLSRPAPREVIAGAARTRPAPVSQSDLQITYSIPQTKPVILVAVGDSFVRAELHHQLHTRYSVVEADDSIDVMELARSLQPALVITASGMDARGACSLCDEIKADPQLKHTPVLWIAPAAGLPNVEDLNISAEDTLSGVSNNESLPIRVENLVEVRQYIQHGGLPEIKVDSEDSAARLADTLFLETVHRLVDDNIGNSLFGLEALAREAQVSLPHLESRLLRLTRLSAAGFLRTKRLQFAVHLLSQGQSPVDVARMTGFHSVSSFNRLFKQVVGVPPDQYPS